MNPPVHGTGGFFSYLPLQRIRSFPQTIQIKCNKKLPPPYGSGSNCIKIMIREPLKTGAKSKNGQGVPDSRKADEVRLYALRGGLTTKMARTAHFRSHEVFRGDHYLFRRTSTLASLTQTQNISMAWRSSSTDGNVGAIRILLSLGSLP